MDDQDARINKNNFHYVKMRSTFIPNSNYRTYVPDDKHSGSTNQPNDAIRQFKNNNEVLIETNLIAKLLVLIFIASLCRYYYLVLSRRKPGFRGPLPWPFVGNLLNMILYNRSELEVDWRRKFGKIYMTYMLSEPRLVIADASVARDMLVTNFDSFSMQYFPSMIHKYQESSIFRLSIQRWRKVRSLMTPAFTSGKIKKMFNLLDRVSDDLVGIMSEHFQTIKKSTSRANENQALAEYDPRDSYFFYTLDGISTCCFGISLDQRNAYRNMKQITDSKKIAERGSGVNNCSYVQTLKDATYFPFWWQTLPMLLPKPFLYLTNYYKKQDKRFMYIAKQINAVLESRKGKMDKFDDYLSSMHSARLGQKLEFARADGSETHHGFGAIDSNEEAYRQLCDKVQKEAGIDKTVELTHDEFLANTIMLMIVGSDTTRALLSSVTYALSFHQEYQARIYEEFKAIAKVDQKTSKVSFEYDDVTQLPILDAFISETLRTMSPVLFMTRACTEDYKVPGYNVTIKRGEVVHISIEAIHFDEEYWQDPFKFNPDRFLPENRDKIWPGSYIPFSVGPRQCLGMRFALTELKISLAKLVYNFEFVPAKGTSFPPPEGYSSFLKVYDIMKLGIRPRN